MKTLKITTIMFLFVFGLLNAAAASKPASVMLREGLYAEEVDGDIDAAIKIYEEIIQDKSATRENVAQALYRQGMCCMKKKDEAGARTAFGRIIAEYADQTDMIEKAKPLLDDLMNYDTAALMPPETLAYVELGSPGEQIETLLNMLKGTPFENPLAVIGGGNMGGGGGQKSAADIVSALLNPSMMAEFKKIKGMAIGVTGIRANNPPSIAVFYPGKSDALRGIILMGLGMVGQRSEPIQGMETLNIQNSASAAYDDKVIIVASSTEQLTWCIKQYKGITSEPTLASSNKSFAKISKKQRQTNAMTVWANVDEAYTQLVKMGQSPLQGLLQANAIGDFNNIDEFIMTVSFEPNSLNCKANLLFKDGHHCMAYDLVRTPNIKRSALEAVPSQAIAAASFALGQANGIQAEKISANIQNVTGLDVGREIYSNIEEVAIYVMPLDKTAVSWDSLPGCLGFAITSRDPERTRQLISTMLVVASAMGGNQQSAPADANAGKFRIGKNGNWDVYCYMDQVNNTTLLSLNRNNVDASIGAVNQKKNICNSGLLAPALSKLPITTSKVVLVNAGGVIRLAAPSMNFGPLSDEQRNQLKAAIEQLAAAAEKTTIEIRTDEEINNFALSASVSGIPPLNEVLGPVSQIVSIGGQIKNAAIAKKFRDKKSAVIMPAATPPVIDGNEDEVWSAAEQYKITNVSYSPLSSPNDLTADFRALWDANNLYMLIDVTDDVLINDTRPDQLVTLPTGSTAIPWWYDDCVEVYIDADNSKSAQYDNDDAQYHFDWDKTNPTMGTHNEHGRMENIEFAMVTTEKGYRTEIKFPWATLGRKPYIGMSIGGDVHINDDDDGGERDSKIAAFDKEDAAWNNPQAFGNAELAGLVGWWKFDETEGSTAKDSSGNNHDGILNGDVKWTQGKIGGAVELDGKSGFIRIADKSAFDIGGQVTVACWVNIRSVSAEYAAIVTKGDSSWRLSMLQNQKKFHTSVNDWQQLVVDGPTEVTVNEWHHAVAVYNGEEMRLYIDGRLDASKPWKGGIAKNDFDVLIGENAEQKGRCFDGLIDDVRIYNYALKEVDIMALYNEGAKQ